MLDIADLKVGQTVNMTLEIASLGELECSCMIKEINENYLLVKNDVKGDLKINLDTILEIKQVNI